MTSAIAGERALDTAERLLPVEAVLNGLPDHDRGTLAGLAGTAILQARLSTVDDQFAQAAVNHWHHAASHARHHPAGQAPAGIFTGPGALATSLILGAPYLPEPGRHQDAAARAARWLSARACAISDHHRARLDSRTPTMPWSVYDTINGLAGIGRVLLAAVALGHTDAHDGLHAALTTLTTMVGATSTGRPGWWLPADQHPTATAIHPSGAATTGLAHGVAGPLALLAIAHIAGQSVTGQPEAIQHAARWLLNWQEPAPASTWPPHVTGAELDHGTAVRTPGRRDAWCYGTPGLSRALILAGDALADERLRIRGQQALTALASRPLGTWDTEGPSLCHGHAGVLKCATEHPTLADLAAREVVAAFDSSHRYGFQHLHRGTPTDDPGLLTGAAGIALALADHGNLPAPVIPTRWDSILLLS